MSLRFRNGQNPSDVIALLRFRYLFGEKLRQIVLNARPVFAFSDFFYMVRAVKCENMSLTTRVVKGYTGIRVPVEVLILRQQNLVRVPVET